MKNFSKIMAVAFISLLVAALFALNASAVATQPGADPRALVPGSDRVIFIQDNIIGDGSGSSPQNPLRPIQHPDFDSSADIQKNHLNTSFYQATEMLKDTGGTIVITGPVHFGEKQSYGASSVVRDVFTAKFGNNVIKFTSVYNGIDYREVNGAKITIEKPASIGVLGSSIWEYIDIETKGNERIISFDEYCTWVGTDVNCYPSDELFEDVPQSYVSLSAGHRYAKSSGENPTLLVQSGTYNVICGGIYGAVATAQMENANTNLILEGSTTVLGIVSGSVYRHSGFSGNVNITINGGKYECDIFGVGSTGFLNNDGKVKLKINGGDFKNAWSVGSEDMGHSGNRPAYSELDFSGWTGSIEDLAFVYACSFGFGVIKFPAGVTKDRLLNIIYYYESESSEAPASPVTPTPTTPSDTSGVPETNYVPETSIEPEETKEHMAETGRPAIPSNPAEDYKEADRVASTSSFSTMLLFFLFIIRFLFG